MEPLIEPLWSHYTLSQKNLSRLADIYSALYRLSKNRLFIICKLVAIEYQEYLQNVKKYIQVIFAEAFIQFKGQYRNFYLQIFIVNLCCDSIVVFAWIMQLCFCLLRRQRSVYALGW